MKNTHGASGCPSSRFDCQLAGFGSRERYSALHSIPPCALPQESANDVGNGRGRACSPGIPRHDNGGSARSGTDEDREEVSGAAPLSTDPR